jgi:hypothetical protein
VITHRCKNCLWFDDQHPSAQFIERIEWKSNPGFCRRRRPSAVMVGKNYIGIQPVMDADEFCGEFKEDK